MPDSSAFRDIFGLPPTAPLVTGAQTNSLLSEIHDYAQTIASTEFSIETSETQVVPHRDSVTFDDLDTLTKKCVVFKSCVLFVDMRESTKINEALDSSQLTKLYTVFIESMIRAARLFGGEVRNIVGDRVMVVFPPIGACTRAIHTAGFMQKISDQIIAPLFSSIELRCGIGIDFGKTHAVKVGVVKQGVTNSYYQNIVFLGQPANIASKLTDIANTPSYEWQKEIHYGYLNIFSQKIVWLKESALRFYRMFPGTTPRPAEADRAPDIIHVALQRDLKLSNRHSTILVTEDVFSQFKKEKPLDNTILNGWWKKENVKIDGRNVFGASIYYG